MHVPLLDLKAQIAPLREDILNAIIEVIDSTRYILGPKVTELEEKISDYCDVSHGVGVSSGTDALLISLMAIGIGPGDIVITTPYSFFATAGVIARLHAKPVFVDIDPITYNLDPDRLLDALETGVVGHISKISFEVSKVKAIIPVHLYGQCADMENILKIASKFHIPIIEDAAQAIGAEFPMGDEIKKAGSMGIMGCFSFFPSKNLGCMGDGGMVVTNDESLSEKLRILRVHGGKPKYFHKIIGGNFRLDPIQAAILIIKYPFLNQWHIARQQNADQYNRLFQEAGLLENGAIKIPQRIYQAKNPAMKFDHIYNQYVIRVKDRDNLKTYLKSKGIVTEIYYPVPFHLQDCFAFLGYQKGDFPESEKAADSTLALPIYPEITEEKQNYVVECMKDFLTKEIVAWI